MTEKILETVAPYGDLRPVASHVWDNATDKLMRNIPSIRKFKGYGRPHYRISYSNTEYGVQEFKFYDALGKLYSTPELRFKGELALLEANYIGFPSTRKVPKRLAIHSQFDWAEASKERLIFFTSLGRRGRSINQADLYIPIEYLIGLGFELIEVTEGTTKTMLLRTPLFEFDLESELIAVEDAMLAIREELTKSLDKCVDVEDMAIVFQELYYKYRVTYTK